MPSKVVAAPRAGSVSSARLPDRTPDRSSSNAPIAEPALPAPPAVTVGDAWRQALAAWLAGHKSYPTEARRDGIEGSVTLRFSVDRTGRVMDVTVLRGSGSRLLDSAAESMLRNAMMPAPTPAIQDRITVSVQVHYKLADQVN